jgi:hypothetical protein
MSHPSHRSLRIAGGIVPLMLGVLLTAGTAYADGPPPSRDLTGERGQGERNNGGGRGNGGRDCGNPDMLDPCANGWQ